MASGQVCFNKTQHGLSLIIRLLLSAASGAASSVENDNDIDERDITGA